MIRGRVSLKGWQRRVDLLRETVTASLDLSHGSNVMDGVRRNTRLQMACLPMSYPPCPATGVWRKASEKFQVDDNSSDVNVAARRLPNVGHTTRPFMFSYVLTIAWCGWELRALNAASIWGIWVSTLSMLIKVRIASTKRNSQIGFVRLDHGPIL